MTEKGRTKCWNNCFLLLITEECGKGEKMEDIFKRIRQAGFKGKLSAFYSWFCKNYPDYKQNSGQTALCKEMAERQKPVVLFDTLSAEKYPYMFQIRNLELIKPDRRAGIIY